MASKDDAQEALFAAITEAATSQSDAASLRDLAEAWAWLNNPSQPHGGSVNQTR